MSNAALAFLAGLGGGYLQQTDKDQEKARQAAKDQRDQEEHDARMAEVKRKQDADAALRAAGQPVTVNNGATVTGVAAAPTTYDSADVASSDVRQANRLAEISPPAAASGMPDASAAAGTLGAAAPAPASMSPAPVVAGTAYPDAASAQTAASAANSPQAVRTRQVAALQGIDPERAMRLQASGLQVDQAEQQAADLSWRRKVSAAMINGGHEGLADLVSNTEHGPASGVKLKAVASADGKTVTYNKVAEDGTLTPTGLTFTNDGDGMARAAAALDQAISPGDRVKMAQADAKEAREGRKTDAEIKKAESDSRESDARAGYYKAAAGAQDAKANKTVDGKPFKLDEDDKLRLTSATQRVRDAEKAVTDAMGKLMPGDDPSKSPGVVYAQGLLRQAKTDHLKTNIELGQIPASSMVTQVLGVAKNQQDVMKSLNELAGVGGTDYADQVAAGIQQTDQWKQWTQPKAAPARPAPAAAQGMGAKASAPAPAARAAASPAQAAPAAGDDARGQRLDQAREVLRRLQASAPGLAKGRQATEEYRAAVEEARTEVQQAQAAYERSMQGQVKPFFGGPRPAAASGFSVLGQ